MTWNISLFIFYMIHIRKNSYLNEGWLFIGKFKVGSLPRMMNEELLAKFKCKST